MPTPRRSARSIDRDALKSRVLAACELLIMEGRIPSERALREALPGFGAHLLLALRDELRDAGLIDWDRAGRNPCRTAGDGLTGASEAERIQVEKNRRKVKADMLRLWRSGRTNASRPGGFEAGDAGAPREPRVCRYLGPRSNGRART